MASKELIETWKSYQDYHRREGADESFIEACVMAAKTAVDEEDLPYAFSITKTAQGYIDEIIRQESNGSFEQAEEWAQEHKQDFNIIYQHYELLKIEAPYIFESYLFYVEKNRPRKERFYEPRKRTLGQVAKALQKLEDDELDELFIHMPARVGKSQLITLFSTWHCARDAERSNLYVTYKEGLGGAFLDGVKEILTDPTYCFNDVFPTVKIVDTDAKNNKLDLNRKKKYKTLSGKGLECGLNGEYDAYGIMILDDILEGVQDVLSADVLKRKQTIFDNNVMSRPKENCKIIYNGTIWATNDLFMNRLEFLETNDTVKNKRYEVIKIPALDPQTDESNFEYDYGVGYSTEYYRARRAKFEMNDDLAGWFAQCQQEPIDRTGAVFNAEHLHYFAVLPQEEPLKIIAHCDVALGGGDFLSFPIVYCYENGDMYCEDVVFDNSEKHITQPKVVSKIKSHEIRNVHFEANQGGEGYKDDVKRILEEDGVMNVNITSDWAPSTKRKEQRIWDNAEAIRNIFFREPSTRDADYRNFMQNLLSFTMVHSKRKHDDAADSLSGLIDFDKNGSGVATVTAVQNPFRRGK